MPPAPTRLGTFIFELKASALRLRRTARDLRAGRVVSLPPTRDREGALPDSPMLAESRSPLWSSTDDADSQMQLGKVHNLRAAIRLLDGVHVPPGAVLSFWAQVGRPSRHRGFVEGRELREGCLIASVGGGLCQLSNALYDAALSAELEIVERHAHSQVIPGSRAELGRDATVFWNYVDLRLRSSNAFRVEAQLTASELVVRIHGARRAAVSSHQARPSVTMPAPSDCATCGRSSCFRHRPGASGIDSVARAAALVDDHWPEHDDWLASQRGLRDVMMLPLDGVRFGRTAYAWCTDGAAEVREARLLTLARSFRSRRLSAQGAARQRALLTFDERLAEHYAATLPADAVHLTVTQSLLPFLWRSGALGGRTFDVLMTRLPFDALHGRLDAAAADHPESTTLGDFRAPDEIVRAERDALARANRLVTPHAEIARLYGDRAIKLRWKMPDTADSVAEPRSHSRRILFPAATVGRKGCYELRDAARALDLEVVLAGPVLESPDFWSGSKTLSADRGPAALASVAAVVLPAYVEHRPRSLLTAIAAGVPVVATPACGLDPSAGIHAVPSGNRDALIAMLRSILTS